MNRILVILSLFIVAKSTLFSQNADFVDVATPLRHYDFFIPGSTPAINVQYKDYSATFKEGVVFKSPIQHQAIFCRLEDISQKKMKIVFQIHMGDYSSNMDMIVPRY